MHNTFTMPIVRAKITHVLGLGKVLETMNSKWRESAPGALCTE